jgi:hypothetical protein
VALVTSGCSDFVDSDQLHASPDSRATLTPDDPVGQTFVARHGGLDGVEFWLDPGPGSEGELRLHLRAEPDAEEDLTTATLPLTAVTAPGFYRFSFSPLRNSHGRYYYAFVEMAGTGEIDVDVGPGHAYLDGALHRDHEPQDAQSRFRLIYDPRGMGVDLVGAAIRGAGLLGVAGLLYVVPGWALLAWLWPERLSWAERLGLAAGVSLALYPLLFLWTDLVGLHLGALYAWVPIGCGLAALVWRYRDWRPREGWKSLKEWAHSDALWPDLALLVVMGLVFGVRLLVVRTLDAPMWGDSYQHTMIAQLMVDNGGLFESWEPYTPYRSLTVHHGFPAMAALLSWVTKMGSVQATLWTGQLVNGIAVLTLYPLAVRLADGKRWAGAGAVLTAGLLSPMPAYYVNWGRYAQLAGQAILPVALWLLWNAVQGTEKGMSWKALLLAGSVLSGMTLAYYRMPFYYALFVLSWLVGWGVPHWKTDTRYWLTGAGRLTLIAGIALLLFFPWGVQIAGGRLATAMGTGITEAPSSEYVLAEYRVWRDIDSFVPYPLLILGLVALGWSLVQRRWAIASVGLWILGLASLVASALIHLPGANMMQNFAILIALYIPVGLLAGWALAQIANLAQRWRRVLCGGVGVLALATAAWGAIGQTRIVNSSFIMVTRPDARAMTWIESNTPPDARFLVEGFRIYGGQSAVGADAGWWLPLLAGRENTMPPQYALLNEVPADPDYNRKVVDLIAHLEEASPATLEGVQLLCDWGVTHVYVGQGQGRVGAGALQLFSPETLEASSSYHNIYHQDRARVFALVPQLCGATVE